MHAFSIKQDGFSLRKGLEEYGQCCHNCEHWERTTMTRISTLTQLGFCHASGKRGKRIMEEEGRNCPNWRENPWTFSKETYDSQKKNQEKENRVINMQPRKLEL